MPELASGDVFAGLLTVLATVMLRAGALKPRLSAVTLLLTGVAGAFLLPPAVAMLERAWPAVTPDKLFIGAWVALLVLFIGNVRGRPPRVPLWAGLLAGAAVAVLLPPLLDAATGRYQRASLRADVNHCTKGMTGQVQPRVITNVCDEPITVGLCLPGETNPEPCAQSRTLAPGQVARFDPGDARLSSLPGNPGGLTVVACRPPARPSRTGSTGGRGYEGVCLPPG